MAPAALLSAALGFGLQRFIQDIGAGFFITAERQYGFGDVVGISVTGVPEPAVGTDRGRHVLGAHGGADAARHAVRRRPGASRPGRVRLPS